MAKQKKQTSRKTSSHSLHSSPASVALKIWLRDGKSGEIALGPGRVQLLRLIEVTGSLSSAAKAMRMSYMNAWTLIREMNRSFTMPLVHASRGGGDGGRARLTTLGKKLVVLYDEMRRETDHIVLKRWKQLSKQAFLSKD